jgi:hypothetical protein
MKLDQVQLPSRNDSGLRPEVELNEEVVEELREPDGAPVYVIEKFQDEEEDPTDQGDEEDEYDDTEEEDE